MRGAGRWSTEHYAWKQQQIAWALNPVKKKGSQRGRNRAARQGKLKRGYCWIYALTDPRTGLYRYIGKSTSPARRLQQHLEDRESNFKKTAWLDELKDKGLQPTLQYLEQCPIETWPERERHWIARYKPQLLNMTDGGDQSAGGTVEHDKRKFGGGPSHG